mgnify:CR=1 FL=1
MTKRTVTLKLQRREVGKLLVALTAVSMSTDGSASEWQPLHDKIKQMLDDADKED